MIILEQIQQSVKLNNVCDGVDYGIDFSNWLTAPNGGTVTITGTPNVTGVNCTATHLATTDGVVYFRVTQGVRQSRGRVGVDLVLSNGETPGRGIDIDFV